MCCSSRPSRVSISCVHLVRLSRASVSSISCIYLVCSTRASISCVFSIPSILPPKLPTLSPPTRSLRLPLTLLLCFPSRPFPVRCVMLCVCLAYLTHITPLPISTHSSGSIYSEYSEYSEWFDSYNYLSGSSGSIGSSCSSCLPPHALQRVKINFFKLAGKPERFKVFNSVWSVWKSWRVWRD